MVFIFKKTNEKITLSIIQAKFSEDINQIKEGVK